MLEEPQSRTILDKMDDECLSLLVHRDDESLQENSTTPSITSSKRSIVFDFDRELFMSRIYDKWIHGSVKKSLKEQQGCPPDQTTVIQRPVDHLLSTQMGGLKINSALENRIEMSGTPWLKQGPVTYKHFYKEPVQRAKNSKWNEMFVVIHDGQITLWRLKDSREGEPFLRIPLAQAFASCLPRPGYSKRRPHVWALSTSAGAVELFHVDSHEVAQSFVMEVNYWGARFSLPLLLYECATLEYGWSKVVVPRRAYGTDISEIYRRNMKRLGDEIEIAGWEPLPMPAESSDATEKVQLGCMQTYVQQVEEDLRQHNFLRNRIKLAFDEETNNAKKAMDNWSKKSTYLLQQIVKFRSYIEVLHEADRLRKDSDDNTEAQDLPEKEIQPNLVLSSDANDSTEPTHT